MLVLTVTTSISLRTEVDRLLGMKDKVMSISPHKQNITKHSSALYIGMAKVLPIIDVFRYDGQNSSFFFSLFRFNTHNSKRKPYITIKRCEYVDFCNAKRLVILTCLYTTLFTSKRQMPQAIHYKGRYVAV